MTKYCLDSGVLINAWRKHYPPNIFQSFWSHLSRLIENEIAIVSREAYEEIAKKEDDLFEWLKEHCDYIRDATEDVVLALKAIMQDDYLSKIVKARKGRSGGDPWIIAHAQVWKATVVTEENEDGKEPKIPDVCAALNIPYMRTVDMLAATGFSF